MSPRIRCHIQNHPGQVAAFQAPEQVWRAGAARHPELADRLEVSIGWTDDDFERAIGSAEILFTWIAVLRERFRDAAAAPLAPALRMIYVTSSGVDQAAPLDWLPPGVMLVNNRGTHGPKAGEWGLMAILMLANLIPRHVTFQRERRWQKAFSSGLAGQTLVSIGVGALASQTLHHVRGFGMQVIGVRAHEAPHPDCDEVVPVERLDEVLPRADHLLIACPLTDATRGLVTRERLAMLKPEAGVVNMARGGILDQEALCDMLDQGRLSGAVLDVVTPEPPPADSRIWTTPNLIVTPHVSADDPTTYTPRSIDIFYANLRAWLDGEPVPNHVTTGAAARP
jgi:phosphoglycerate dehydrogenase-like enzyme